mmetsp:Transcript_22714/g.37586  ORF Transcript_22714/g.37586 Transcript_22714/m.37586 type:complete len:390 (+) Transcript_22714:301-1470(+)|eukprot:CAMPEP_0119018894 /NCGR_PEP_ID=MMETSP1176-20130426/20524_1 /TAXON_ID=265551 /ORGANISM="Synedropsis recta cf, Strain CCMP1620" /LENGTH=389 /DNA_ID=CAMNT_0006972995 /DNA_START=290 /DNA_END=1459 /DNA_ORIENTATION=-
MKGLVVFLLCCVAFSTGEEDFYSILGVAKTATVKEIKSAYRRKALETHPDKNGNASATAEFIKVVQAFEVLTDEGSRKTFDSTGKAPQHTSRGDGSFHNDSFSAAFDSWFIRAHGFALSEVREAQARTLHLTSLQQLQDIMSDESGKLEHNLLLIFVTPQAVESAADDKLFFPYPFTTDLDVLQAVKVRYHRENDLTRFFQVPNGDDLRKGGNPVVIFGKQGQQLEESATWERLETVDRNFFEAWMWQCLRVTVTLVNEHTHPVEVYWVQYPKHQLMIKTLHPGDSQQVESALTRELWIRDVRVDSFEGAPRKQLSRESTLLLHTVAQDQEEVHITPTICLDLSAQCNSWEATGECLKNQPFMSNYCQKSCGICSHKIGDAANNGQDEL